jgi:hopene-associated glycosyltransferase HpnB
MIALCVGLAGVLVWAYLLAARGRFWLADIDDTNPIAASETRDTPGVVAIIPARNEAELIAETLRSIALQNYAGSLCVVVVDDHSSDGTADIARQVAAEFAATVRIDVVHAPELEAGWTGKLSALNAGVSFASSESANDRFFWFTDADIRYAAGTLARSIARVQAGDLVLVSYMARLRTRTFIERALVPAFVFFFQMLYPFRWVNDVRRGIAAAAGGCVLVRRDALVAVGGLAAIGGELIDDCALARRLKTVGPIWLGLCDGVQSVRAYDTWSEIRQMICRCAYAQLRYSPWLLCAVVVAMSITYFAPVALAVFAHGGARAAGVTSWLLMTFALQPMLARYRLAPLWGAALPIIALVYLILTLDSALQYCRGAGGMWKGRPQAGRQGAGAGN